MKLTAIFLSVLFSGSLAFAHCGSCDSAKTDKKPACSKSKKSHKHAKCDKKEKCSGKRKSKA